MDIQKTVVHPSGIAIPAITLTSPGSRATAIVVHGFGGNKEELLGLAFRIADQGLNVYCIDQRGHGENRLPFGPQLLDDLNALIDHLACVSEKILVVGHSLGGRLALLSRADFRVGISPAIENEFSNATKAMIKNMRDYRVAGESTDRLFEILRNMPSINDSFALTDLILYGSRDIPEIIARCEQLASVHPNVTVVPHALHGDIVTLESTFAMIGEYVRSIGN